MNKYPEKDPLNGDTPLEECDLCLKRLCKGCFLAEAETDEEGK